MKDCIYAIASILVLIVLGVVLIGCDMGPSCEERGGKLKYTTTILIYQPSLKMMQQFPQYKCVMPEKAGASPHVHKCTTDIECEIEERSLN